MTGSRDRCHINQASRDRMLTCSFLVDFDLTKIIDEVTHLKTENITNDEFSKLERKLEKLRYYAFCGFDYPHWAEFNLQTSNIKVAEKRLRATKAKVDRAIVRWANALPKREDPLNV